MEVAETGRIKVLIGDDHSIVLRAVAMSLASYGIEVIGEAKTPGDVIRMYSDLAPDVLVLDIKFGEKKTGLDAAKEILQNHPDVKIVFLSQIDQDSLIKETYKIGGYAFITKDCDPIDLATAVTKAHEGELYFLPHIAERLANLSVRGDDSPWALLDQREVEIFKLMAQGCTNVEIAAKTSLSAKTISNTSQTIKEKLGMHRPAEITRLALRHGLIEP